MCTLLHTPIPIQPIQNSVMPALSVPPLLVIPDTLPPYLTQFDIDMNSGYINLTFSKPVVFIDPTALVFIADTLQTSPVSISSHSAVEGYASTLVVGIVLCIYFIHAIHIIHSMHAHIHTHTYTRIHACNTILV